MPNVTPGSVYSTSPPVVTDQLVDRRRHGQRQCRHHLAVGRDPRLRRQHRRTGLELRFQEPGCDGADRQRRRPIRENAPNSWSVSSYDPEARPDLPADGQPVARPVWRQPQRRASRNTPRRSWRSTPTPARSAWVYQTVHHDLWDMDVPAQPSLIDLTIDGKTVPALVAPTKQGEVYRARTARPASRCCR